MPPTEPYPWDDRNLENCLNNRARLHAVACCCILIPPHSKRLPCRCKNSFQSGPKNQNSPLWTALSGCVLEHMLDACQFLGSFTAIALQQSSIFPAYKHNLGDATAKHILHAIIYSEKATLVPAEAVKNHREIFRLPLSVHAAISRQKHRKECCGLCVLNLIWTA